MQDHAVEALAILRNRSLEDFSSDRTVLLAVTHLLEIIGEAANRIPLEERVQFPIIDWGRMIGMRNRLVHGYDIIDVEIVWRTTVEDLPPLIKQVADILAKT